MKSKLTDFLEQNRQADNVCPPPMTAEEFEAYIVKYLLGDDYCVIESLGVSQVRTIELLDILKKHSPEFRKEFADWIDNKK